MTAVRIARAAVAPYTFDVGRSLVTARTTLRYRRGYHVKLEDEEGRTGWGDAAHFAGFGSGDEAIGEALSRALEDLRGAAFESADELEAWLDRGAGLPEVRHAIELAWLDLFAQRRGIPLAKALSSDAADFAETHVLLTSVHHAREAVATGATTFKLKIGSDVDAAEHLVRSLRASVGSDVRLRLDANGVFDAATAKRLLERLAPLDIALLEQPTRPGDLAALARVRSFANALGIAIAADEDVTDEASLEALLAHEAADVVVLKPMFLGGLLRARRLAVQAMARGVRVLVTHALESGVGRTGAVHLAATLPGTHGLAWSPESDVATSPAREGARMPLPDSAGLGSHTRSTAPRATLTSPTSFPGLPDPLHSSALARPDHPAITFEGSQLRYGELSSRAARVARALADGGLRRGARVALAGPPSLDWVVALHAVRLAGATACPLPHWPTPIEREAVLKAIDFDHIVDTAQSLPEAAAPLPEVTWRLEEIQLVVVTSGSTGTPKAIPLAAGQVSWSAFGSALRLGHLPNDCWLDPLPLHHVGGLSVLLRCTLGATTARLFPRFDAARVATDLDSGEVSLVSLTPTMLERVLDARPARPFPNEVRAVLVGGGPATEALVRRCRDLGIPLALTWGMTEAASQLATRFPGDTSPLATGLPVLPFVRASERGGSLVVTGPSVNGALVTADRGRVEGGRIVVTGRTDAVIVRAGENLDPREIELALEAHPAVAEAAVVGLPSATHGHEVGAMLVARGARPDMGALMAHCRARLAAYKVPSQVVWAESLPRTSLGKLARASLVDAFENASLLQAQDEHGGRSCGGHVGEPHADVHQLAARTHVGRVAGTMQRVSEDERSTAEFLQRDRDVDAVVKPNRLDEVRLGVNERQADTRLRDQPLDPTIPREQELLVSGVTHLEHASEEQDPSSIHLEEARSGAMNERHDHERRQQP